MNVQTQQSKQFVVTLKRWRRDEDGIRESAGTIRKRYFTRHQAYRAKAKNLMFSRINKRCTCDQPTGMDPDRMCDVCRLYFQRSYMVDSYAAFIKFVVGWLRFFDEMEGEHG